MLWKKFADEKPQDGEKCFAGMEKGGKVVFRSSTCVEYTEEAGWYSVETGDSLFHAYPVTHWIYFKDLFDLVN
jgi:hypothetical protein